MTDTTKWTEGPWRSGPSGWNMSEKYTQPFNVYEADKPNLIAGCFGDVRGGENVARANARLIASAPALYEALAKLDTWWTAEFPKGPDTPDGEIISLSTDTKALWREIRTALTSARGDQS